MLMKAVGMMSGTSMDGIDVAYLETDGAGIVRPGPTLFVPYDDDIRRELREAMRTAPAIPGRLDRPGALGVAEQAVTRATIDAAGAFFARTGILAEEIDVIGMHGQTVFHAPERGLTVQLGDGELVSRVLGAPVVYDLRADDVAAGGQGAPLVPVYHRALVAAHGLDLPAVVINLGGVGNLTYVGPGGGGDNAGGDGGPGEGEGNGNGNGAALIAFDTGPGNALIDDLVEARTGARMDAGGAIAARGRIDGAALGRLMDHPYFDLSAPKSLDRDAFAATPVADLSLEDAAATLVAFTAASLARGFALLPAVPTIAIVTGGGARNPAIVAALSDVLPCSVATGDALGWSAEFVEAQAFAYLAVRSMSGRPLTYPGTTGVAAPQTGGVVAGGRTRMPSARMR